MKGSTILLMLLLLLGMHQMWMLPHQPVQLALRAMKDSEINDTLFPPTRDRHVLLTW